MEPEFCVVCGRRDRPLTDGECPDCFADRSVHVSAPDRPLVTICPTCGARKVGQHWEPSDAGDRLTADDLTPLLTVHPEAAVRRVQWTERSGSPMLRELEGEARVRIREVERTRGLRVTVRIEHRTCPSCSRRSGRYYTAILQLRGLVDGPYERPRERRERLERAFASVLPDARGAWRSAIGWREPLPEGWDYFFTDTLAARAVARLAKARLRADLKETASLWGRRDGREVYRVTLRLRIPPGPAPEPAAPRPGRRLERQT